LPDGNTIYFIVFGVIALFVVVLFGRKDPAAFEEKKRQAIEDVERPYAEPSADQDQGEHDGQNPLDEDNRAP